MSEQDQGQQLYPSPSKLPSIRDLQSRQKQFNKVSAQRLSTSKQAENQQFQDASIPPVQQPPSSQMSGKKYYQSRYIHSPGQALSYQRSGSKAQERNYELDNSVQQTPVSQFSMHGRNKSEFQQSQVQQSWEIDPGLVDDSQIEQFVEQLLLDDLVAQQLREQKNMKGFQVGKGVKELVLRLTNQIMMNQGLRQQQSIAFSGQYNTLKQDYLKLQSEFSRRVAEQNDRIQMLENECREKEELLIRESKTRQMLENQNQENTKRLSEVTGEYHSKLQLKEDIFYQKGQECYNEINVLRQLVGELQEKVQIKETEVNSVEEELARANERVKVVTQEREIERNSLEGQIYGLRQRVELMEGDEKEMVVLVEQLKGELTLVENQCVERENHIRVSEEDKKRDMEGYELMLKEKDQQRAFEVNNLVQLGEIQRTKESELREKYMMKIGLIEDEVKKFLVFKQDVVSWIYQQKNQMLASMKVLAQKSNETINKNASWYKKLLKERDSEYNQLVQSQEKEINNLNERWQEMMQQQEMQLRNEHRSELLQEIGKMEAKGVAMQGQINDYQANYMRIKERNEGMVKEQREWREERERLLSQIGELDCGLEDSEWKYEKEVEENKLLAQELLSLQKIQEETERKLNDIERRRILTEGQLNSSQYKGDLFQRDIKGLLGEIQSEKSKYEQNDKEKRCNQENVLLDRNEIIKLGEEIVQREYEITKLKSCIASKDVELQENEREKQQLKQAIEEQKLIIEQRDQRIRQIEIISREDLANYLLTNKLQAELMEALKQEKEMLVKHISELDKAHKKEMEDKQKEKIRIIEELHRVIAQLNERNNELREEKRTVEGLLANKKKLEQIVENLTKNIEELNEKLMDTEQKLKQCEEAKENLQNNFNDYKLQQLKQKKSQLLSAKKILAGFKAEYLEHKNSIENIIDEQNANLQVLRDSIEQQLNQLAVQYAQELNNLRMNLDQSHTDYMNQLLYQEKERGRVQVETVRKQLGEQIIQLSEEINNLKKKLQNIGGEKQIKGQNLDASEMVKRFSTQQLQDIQSRYLNIKSELDSIVSDTKGKYEAIQQLHSQTAYTKEQVAQLKHFADIQDVLSSIILQSEELLKKYQELDAKRDRDLKASQSLMQSKIISQQQSSQQKKMDQEIPCQLTDSFSPTQYNQRKQYEQQLSEQNSSPDNAFKSQKSEN